jgi:tRNA (cmo5U34)-methyltransferase
MAEDAEFTRERLLAWEKKLALEEDLRRQQFDFLLDMLPFGVDKPVRILDLGAGPGALARLILDRFPNASVLLLDGSADALALATERLASYGLRASFVRANLQDRNWVSTVPRDFDAVVSSQVIYMLLDERKRALYRELAGLLRLDGWFLNLDLVAIPDPGLREHYWRVRVDHIRRTSEAAGAALTRDQVAAVIGRSREFADRPYTDLEPQLRWLREAGLVNVDCYWKRLGLALFGGTRPGAGR